MIVNKEEACKIACVIGESGKRKCAADKCMAWKWVRILKDTGCCGLVYPNITEGLVEIFKVGKIKGE